MTHVLFLLVFSAAVGIVLAALLRQDGRDVARLALWIVAALVSVAVVLGWLMYFLPPPR
jgi:ABC-type sugar transport system permease subunit